MGSVLFSLIARWRKRHKTLVASNAYGAPYGKNAHLRFGRDERFLLVKALPQSPQNTGSCSGNAGNFQRLRDKVDKVQIRYNKLRKLNRAKK